MRNSNTTKCVVETIVVQNRNNSKMERSAKCENIQPRVFSIALEYLVVTHIRTCI